MPEENNHEPREGSPESRDAEHSGEPNDWNSEFDRGGYPVPPSNWRPEDDEHRKRGDFPNRQNTDLPDMGVVGNTVIQLSEHESIQFASARKFITASQVTALISLFFGGMLLSSVAIVLAVIGFRKLAYVAECHANQPEVKKAIRRSGIIAIGMAVLAFVINAVTIAAFYPMLVEIMNNGDIASLFTGGQSSAPSSPTSPPPGYDLFG